MAEAGRTSPKTRKGTKQRVTMLTRSIITMIIAAPLYLCIGSVEGNDTITVAAVAQEAEPGPTWDQSAAFLPSPSVRFTTHDAEKEQNIRRPSASSSTTTPFVSNTSGRNLHVYSVRAQETDISAIYENKLGTLPVVSGKPEEDTPDRDTLSYHRKAARVLLNPRKRPRHTRKDPPENTRKLPRIFQNQLVERRGHNLSMHITSMKTLTLSPCWQGRLGHTHMQQLSSTDLHRMLTRAFSNLKLRMSKKSAEFASVAETLTLRRAHRSGGALEKWKVLKVEKPPDIPQFVFEELGDALPPEQQWRKGQQENGKIHEVFRSTLSSRFYRDAVIPEGRCGLAVRASFVLHAVWEKANWELFPQFSLSRASLPCPDHEGLSEETHPLPWLRAAGQLPPPPMANTGGLPVDTALLSKHLRDEELLRFEKLKAVALNRLRGSTEDEALIFPSFFEADVECPVMMPTKSECSTRCGVGTAVQFEIQQEGFSCKVNTSFIECQAISECTSASEKWKALQVTLPESLSESILNELGEQLPDEQQWKTVILPRGDRCDTFGTNYSRRFGRTDSRLLSDTEAGGAVRAYFVREVLIRDDKWICVNRFGMLDADIVHAIDAETAEHVLQKQHNRLRTKFGVHRLELHPDLRKLAIYWASQLELTQSCNLEHSDRQTKVALTGSDSIGENLSVVCTLGDFKYEDVPLLWFNELFCYKYGRLGNPCTAQKLGRCDPRFHAEGVLVGHFTQVMSRFSHSLGCTMRMCHQPCSVGSKKGQRVLVVCNYAEAGNITGKYPFSRAVARKLQKLHPEIFEAPADRASQEECMRALEKWKELNPKKIL